MIRALIDTDVILDVLLARPEFVADAAAIWLAHDKHEFEGYISAITPVNVYYLARKAKGADNARQAIRELLDQWRVSPIDHGVLEHALASQFSDFEDAVQHSSAANRSIEYIVTRNGADYKQATLKVVSPAEFLMLLVSSN